MAWRRRAGAFGVGVAFACGAVGVLVACGTNNLAAAGAECTLATDCEPGLVCVPQRDGKKICSSDLTGVQRPVQPGGGGDASIGEGGEGGASDGALPVDDTGVPDSAIKDTGPPDVTPPTDGSAG